MSGNQAMQCEEIRNRISDYSAGNLDDTCASAVHAHLLQCPDCARELRVLEATLQMVEAVPQVEPPAGIWDAVYAQIATSEPVRKQPFTERIRLLFAPPARAMALGFAVLVLLVVTTFGRLNMVPQQAVADSSTQEYVQGHVVFASEDAFADRIGFASVTAATMTEEGLQ